MMFEDFFVGENFVSDEWNASNGSPSQHFVGAKLLTKIDK